MKNKMFPQMLYIAELFTSPYCVNPRCDRMPDVPAEQRSEFWAS